MTGLKIVVMSLSLLTLAGCVSNTGGGTATLSSYYS